MKNLRPEPILRVRARPAETVPIKIPLDTLAALQQVAERRDMSADALIRFYIGQGLRQDLSRLFSDHVLETAAEVLVQHGRSVEEVATILDEIQQQDKRRWYPWLTKPAPTDT